MSDLEFKMTVSDMDLDDWADAFGLKRDEAETDFAAFFMVQVAMLANDYLRNRLGYKAAEVDLWAVAKDEAVRWGLTAPEVQYREAGDCANCEERIRETIGPGFRIFYHPDHDNHTVCDWHLGMEPTDRVATPKRVTR